MVSPTNKDLLKLKKELTKIIDAVDDNDSSVACPLVTECLLECEEIVVSVADLTKTQIGKTVNQVRKIFHNNADISDLCKKITDKWKETVLEHRQNVKDNIKKKQDVNAEIYMSQDFSQASETTLNIKTEAEHTKHSHKRKRENSGSRDLPSVLGSGNLSKKGDSFTSLENGYTSKSLPYFSKLTKNKDSTESTSKVNSSIIVKEEPKSDEECEITAIVRSKAAKHKTDPSNVVVKEEPKGDEECDIASTAKCKVAKLTVGAKSSTKSHKKDKLALVDGDQPCDSQIRENLVLQTPMDVLHQPVKKSRESRSMTLGSNFTLVPLTSPRTDTVTTPVEATSTSVKHFSSVSSSHSSMSASTISTTSTFASSVVYSTPLSSAFAGSKNIVEIHDNRKSRPISIATAASPDEDSSTSSFSQFILNRDRSLNCNEQLESSEVLQYPATSHTTSRTEELSYAKGELSHTCTNINKPGRKESSNELEELVSSIPSKDSDGNNEATTNDVNSVPGGPGNSVDTLSRRHKHKFARCISNVRNILTNTVESVTLMERKIQQMKADLHSVQDQVHTLQQLFFGNVDSYNMYLSDAEPVVPTAKKRKQRSFSAAKRGRRFGRYVRSHKGWRSTPRHMDSNLHQTWINSEGFDDRPGARLRSKEDSPPRAHEGQKGQLSSPHGLPNSISGNSLDQSTVSTTRDNNETIPLSIMSSSLVHEGSRVPVPLRLPKITGSPIKVEDQQGQGSGNDDLVCFTQVVDDMETCNDLSHGKAEMLRDQRQKFRKSWNDTCKKEEGIHYSPLGKNRGIGALKALHKRVVAKEAIKQVLNRQRRRSGDKTTEP